MIQTLTNDYLKSLNFNDFLKTERGTYFLLCDDKSLIKCYFKTKDNKITVLKDLEININTFNETTNNN